MPGYPNLAERDSLHPAWTGKRTMLDWLRPRLGASRIPEGIGIAYARWCADPSEVVDAIVRRLGAVELAVRSDCRDEDTPSRSNAGHYRTCLGVDGSDRQRLATSIDAVFASYANLRGGDEVFVQRQIAPVRDAAVAFTHALPDAAPYYVLSVARGPRSDTVTRGEGDVDTWYLARDRACIERLPDRCRAYLRALIEIESIAGSSPCEVEMATDEAGQVWLLQARPLAVTQRENPAIATLRMQVERRLASPTSSPPLLGMMPDWNPAELLGEHPRPLARGLFDRLITRRAWHIGRVTLGYARIHPTHLLQVHAGRPYVDVRTSFHSLLPAGLAPRLRDRLVDAWCARLRAQPELHDKIEFEVAFTALTCAIETRFESRYPGLLDARERSDFIAALRAPTRAALDPALAVRLCEGFTRDLATRAPSADPHRLQHWLTRLELRTAVRFAIVARQAFAIEALLRSAVDTGALTATRLADLKRTASATFAHAHLLQYDHVRSGTFEIAVRARRETGTQGFSPLRKSLDVNATPTPIDAREAARLRHALHDVGLEVDPQTLFAHYQRLLRARELGKFALARGVSLTLDALVERAAGLGIDREDAGWLDLEDLLGADATLLRQRIGRARATYQLEARLRMPLLIDDQRLDVVHHASGQANYLGHGHVRGRPLHVDAHTDPDAVPVHAILAIASADPGFDWIFQRRPAALLTAFGGPNSHMAIRCAEAGVPAVLGLGPDAFRRLLTNEHITIDFDACTWTNR